MSWKGPSTCWITWPSSEVAGRWSSSSIGLVGGRRDGAERRTLAIHESRRILIIMHGHYGESESLIILILLTIILTHYPHRRRRRMRPPKTLMRDRLRRPAWWMP